MTTYEKELLQIIKENYSKLSPVEITQKLIEMGVVDHTRLKVLSVRDYVYRKVEGGERKVNAMWIASERFACTYEYIRKCLYYYTDVNVPRTYKTDEKN